MRLAAAALVLAAALGGCSLVQPKPAPMVTVYDFGPPPQPAAAPARAPIVQPVTGPAWLDDRRIDYRLAWRDPAQRASYRDSRWAADAAALLTERLRQRAARAGDVARSLALRVELEEFCHVFASPTASRGVVALRATLVDQPTGAVLRRRSFEVSTDAATPDAAGGAHALAQAADTAIDEVLDWAAAPP